MSGLTDIEQLERTFEQKRAGYAEGYWSKPRHRRQVQAIVDLLPENGTLIDVGGFIGNITAHVSAAKPCRAFLFEPVQGHCDFCRRRFAGNSRITVERLALSDHTGTETIYRGHKNLAWNTILKEITNRRNQWLPPEAVPCLPFDAYHAGHNLGAVDFVKVDVEGFEWKVLKGMRQTIAAHMPHIECEIHCGRLHPQWDEQVAEFEHLFELGYKRFDIGTALDPAQGRKLTHVLLQRP